MRKQIIGLVLSLYASTVLTIPLQHGLTYKKPTGRFGDCIITYCKAKYLAYLYQIPFYYSPFPFSHHLTMHTKEKPVPKYLSSAKRVKVGVPQILEKPSPLPTLYVSSFYTDVGNVYENIIKHPELEAGIKAMLMPSKPPRPLHRPNGFATVALHVRKGSGKDRPLCSNQESPLYAHHVNYVTHLQSSGASAEISRKTCPDKKWPGKFPPDQFYLDSLRKLSSYLNDRPLCVYVFSDQDQRRLIKRYSSRIHKKNIRFALPPGEGDYKKQLIGNFFHLSQCDYLIRPNSGFSQVAELLGDHTIVVHPQSGSDQWMNDTLVFTKIVMRIKKAGVISRFVVDL